MDALPPGTDLSKVPLAPNPNGEPPNFVDPPSLAPAVLAVGIVLVVISVFFVATRIATNLKTVGKLGLDDYFCFTAEILAIGYWALVYDVALAAGRHAWDVPLSTIMDVPFMQKGAAQQIVAGPMFWTSKAAVLLLYLRVFGTLRWFRATTYMLLVFTFCLYMSNVVVSGVLCAPAPGQTWGGDLFAKCSKTAPSAVVLGVLGVVTDLVIFAMPFPVIGRLQLGRQKRIGLSVVFAVGFLAVVASAISLAYRVQAFLQVDPLWNAINATITAFTEVFVTIIVSCAPALSSFWNNIFTKSAIYSSLHSRLMSRSSDAGSDRSRHGPYTWYKSKSNRSDDSSSELKPELPYNQHDYTSSGKLGTARPHVYSGDTTAPTNIGITKSMMIKQSSESG